ncbi:hypothetical protein QAD02_011185 [Eretmocerus hayati]|uniref:Uncharacterized protein n=1 Tax=Eretmocerus hayati TaxID=131215 RepID=A0ACC2NVV5_9HYME|nr:hypothetical protein QAD02_011185 [Eretmocerus hayati]
MDKLSVEDKSNKSSKKCMRKQKRAQHRLARDMDVEYSDSPTQNIAICNAGLVTGLKREILEQFIGRFVPKYQVFMPPGKSYCFIQFQSTQDAERFYKKIHGLVEVPGQNTVFYLLYLQLIPCMEETLSCALPPGLRLLTDFVTAQEELTFLESINWDDEDVNEESELKHRKVKHFGYKFRYDNNLVDLDNPIAPIPESYQILQNRFEKHGCGNHKFDQLTVNRYLPGQGIPPHIDTHSIFEDPILSLSLGSPCVMDFKKGEEKIAVDLPARSLLIMSDEARYAWSHGICPRHNDNVKTDTGLSTRPRGTRVSFTFRKVHIGACSCKYKEYCDSKREAHAVSHLNDSVAAELENSYVHGVYDEISNHFNETRHKQWPNVAKFIEKLETGGLLLDVGCGNGKYLFGQSDTFRIGCDRSFGLAEICQTRGFQVVLADCLQLPYKSNTFDAALCIAVIHHLSTHERRKKAISEIIRVLRTGGRALIYVWAKEQKRGSEKSTYLKFKSDKIVDEAGMSRETQFHTTSNDVSLPIHENRTEFSHTDVLVPWKRKGGGEFLRYYHVFEDGELENLCFDVPSTGVEDVYYDQGNWCVVLRKS